MEFAHIDIAYMAHSLTNIELLDAGILWMKEIMARTTIKKYIIRFFQHYLFKKYESKFLRLLHIIITAYYCSPQTTFLFQKRAKFWSKFIS